VSDESVTDHVEKLFWTSLEAVECVCIYRYISIYTHIHRCFLFAGAQRIYFGGFFSCFLGSGM